MENLTLHDVLLNAKKQGAADVHYVVGSPPVMHLNNEFLPVPNVPVTTVELVTSLAEALLTPEDNTALKEAREILRVFTFPDGLRCRFHLTFQKGSPSLSFHVLSETIPTLASLRLPDEVGHFATLTRGLVLIAGPYGSGRSSTATALLSEINRSRRTNIMTIEAPIEYVLSSERSIVEQRQVGRDVANYIGPLTDLVESDVEVVMVDSLNDPATIPIVLELALTRLVIAIVESIDALHAIENLVASVPSHQVEAVRRTLADALAGVIAQRVVVRANGGLIVIVEVLLGTGPAKAILRDGKLQQLTNIIQTSRAEGMISLDQALAEAVSTGEVNGDEALRHAVDPDYIKTLLERRAKR